MARAGSGPYGFHGSWITGFQGLLGCYNLAFTKEFGSLVFKRAIGFNRNGYVDLNWLSMDTAGFQWISDTGFRDTDKKRALDLL